MIPILKQGEVLITSLQRELTDSEWGRLQDKMLDHLGRYRSKGVVIDVTGMPVMDSFAGRALGDLARMLRLRGAKTVVSGIQPEVAFAMVQLGVTLPDTVTALDLEEGLDRLQRLLAGEKRP